MSLKINRQNVFTAQQINDKSYRTGLISGRLLFFLFLFLYLHSVGFSQEWTLRKDQNDIKVYTREYYGSGFKEIKATLNVKSTLGGVVKLFSEIPSFTKWIYSCTTSYELKKVSPTEGYAYSIVESPWPISNRDLITHYTRTQDPKTRAVLITMQGVKDYIPEVKGLERVTSLIGMTIITPGKDGMIQITHQLHVEPGGYLPGWLANFFVTDGPLNSFLKLKELLELKEYCTYTSDDVLEPESN
jgi:hypothetical protein